MVSHSHPAGLELRPQLQIPQSLKHTPGHVTRLFLGMLVVGGDGRQMGEEDISGLSLVLSGFAWPTLGLSNFLDCNLL